MGISENKQERGARNQSLFRAVNERIEELVDREGALPSDQLGFLCECADTNCTATLALTRDEYEAMRRVPTHFPIKPGHEDPEIERVVQKTDRYTVVEKFGDAGKAAVELDPRRESADEPVPRD